MYKNNIVFLVALTYLITSCDTLSSVKRGLTGEKSLSTDEFLVKKKDPLILPPNFDELPTPGERREALDEEISNIEKKLKKTTSIEGVSSSSSSTEESILKEIRKK